jgi:CHASE2 domain-containing sensor protein
MNESMEQLPLIRSPLRWFGPGRAPLSVFLGTLAVAFIGLMLWSIPQFEAWSTTSYDYLFRFQSATPPTNQVVLVLMDNAAHYELGQERGKWDRRLHAELVGKLADDGAALVVFDVFFKEPRNGISDDALAAALQRCSNVVLMAKWLEAARPEASRPGFESGHPILPFDLFLNAAHDHWGIAKANTVEHDSVVRRHWPFPAPISDAGQSLPWVAGTLTGARLPTSPRKQWLRYYGPAGAWNAFSYHDALQQEPGYFRDKVVFIGSKPETRKVDSEEDEFRTPFTQWSDERGVAGVEILATTFLNLVNRDWLERLPASIEAAILCIVAVILGGGLPLLRIRYAILSAGAFTLVSLWMAAFLTNHASYWFPWLIVVGAQIPAGIAAVVVFRRLGWSVRQSSLLTSNGVTGANDLPLGVAGPQTDLPDAPGYDLVQPAFGIGGYGKVWLARNVAGQWQALKAVYLAKFGHNTEPYDREFRGITLFKPISKKHRGLLEIDYISPKKSEGYFYYVMELGDSVIPDWEADPSTYRPRDLSSARTEANGNRIAVPECVRIGIALADALDFIHGQNLTHRDIKPSNIIFVNGEPKFADVGLVTDAHPNRQHSLVGTLGYMPPAPELPGTPAADIYALGMVLYVISTGEGPEMFPTLPTTLVANSDYGFIALNRVILRACQPKLSQRYASAADLKADLQLLESTLRGDALEGGLMEKRLTTA